MKASQHRERPRKKQQRRSSIFCSSRCFFFFFFPGGERFFSMVMYGVSRVYFFYFFFFFVLFHSFCIRCVSISMCFVVCLSSRYHRAAQEKKAKYKWRTRWRDDVQEKEKNVNYEYAKRSPPNTFTIYFLFISRRVYAPAHPQTHICTHQLTIGARSSTFRIIRTRGAPKSTNTTQTTTNAIICFSCARCVKLQYFYATMPFLLRRVNGFLDVAATLTIL